MFLVKERGLAMMAYCSAPFLGPVLGPIAGGFLGEHGGWRWVDAMTVIFTGALLILGVLLVPETYTPYILVRRAKKLSQMTGKVYKSKLHAKEVRTAKQLFQTAMFRPWKILFFKPIVFLVSVYVAISKTF